MSLDKEVSVRTTIPFPLPPITSPTRPSSKSGRRVFLRQPRVKHSTKGRVDRDLEETHSKLETFLPPNDNLTFNLMTFNKETGDLICTGGICKTSHWFGCPGTCFSLKYYHAFFFACTHFGRAPLT